MRWHGRPPALEQIAEIVAAASLGGATGFFIFHAAPLSGVSLAGLAATGGAAALAGALACLRRLDRTGAVAGVGFELADFVSDGDADEAHDDDELLLDDQMLAIEQAPRVIQLFEREQPDPLPEPGELVTRIADYLGTSRGAARPEPTADRVDATDALHAALADIRRSLR